MFANALLHTSSIVLSMLFTIFFREERLNHNETIRNTWEQMNLSKEITSPWKQTMSTYSKYESISGNGNKQQFHTTLTSYLSPMTKQRLYPSNARLTKLSRSSWDVERQQKIKYIYHIRKKCSLSKLEAAKFIQQKPSDLCNIQVLLKKKKN